MNYYQNNLLVSHKRMMWLSVGSLGFLTIALVCSIIWSFTRYRQATQHTYVFHHKGAAIAIYDERSPLPAVRSVQSGLSRPDLTPYHLNK